ncbi:unnamed protein product [Paramecium sonneborni]|uniref:non-specific serine/threonine protein kinase n=1 Tax=Paramecium sonneborni TaxID=65129 RepID=A0A8S1KR20_9CILI|nr:unnamed protein product [Paramecium sonneborni]
MDQLESLLVKSPTNQYIVYNKILGKGAYGVVLLSKQIKQQQFYAIKIISKKVLAKINGAYNMRQEILFLSKLQHPNIIKMQESFEDENYFYIVLEYCQKGNLYELLKQQGAFSEEKACKYFNQILQAIQFMHKRQIIHRDLKLANILLTSEDNIKICDFNWATELIDGKADPVLCGTVDQMPPEVCSFSYHDTKVDIWSLGVLLYEMIHNSLPVITFVNELSFGRYVSEEAQILLKDLMRIEKYQRPTVSEIYSYKWIKNNIQKQKVQLTTQSLCVTPRHSKQNSLDLKDIRKCIRTEN